MGTAAAHLPPALTHSRRRAAWSACFSDHEPGFLLRTELLLNQVCTQYPEALATLRAQKQLVDYFHNHRSNKGLRRRSAAAAQAGAGGLRCEALTFSVFECALQLLGALSQAVGNLHDCCDEWP